MSRGGKREGAGRPKGSVVYTDDPKRSMTVRLELSLREKAKRIGGGSVSDGIRLALKNYNEREELI